MRGRGWRSRADLVPALTRSSKGARANRFDDFGGYFFFPLLQRFDAATGLFDLIGRDALLLSRLVYVLGVVLHAAGAAAVAQPMAAALLESVDSPLFFPFFLPFGRLLS